MCFVQGWLRRECYNKYCALQLGVISFFIQLQEKLFVYALLNIDGKLVSLAGLLSAFLCQQSKTLVIYLSTNGLSSVMVIQLICNKNINNIH